MQGANEADPSAWKLPCIQSKAPYKPHQISLRGLMDAQAAVFSMINFVPHHKDTRTDFEPRG